MTVETLNHRWILVIQLQDVLLLFVKGHLILEFNINKKKNILPEHFTKKWSEHIKLQMLFQEFWTESTVLYMFLLCLSVSVSICMLLTDMWMMLWILWLSKDTSCQFLKLLIAELLPSSCTYSHDWYCMLLKEATWITLTFSLPPPKLNGTFNTTSLLLFTCFPAFRILNLCSLTKCKWLRTRSTHYIMKMKCKRYC